MSAPLVMAEGLNFSYGSGATAEQILRDVSVEIAPGEIVLLSGPSGSGKTTLLTLLGCLRSVQSGTLQVLDTKVSAGNAEQRRLVRKNIGFIFQQHNLLKFLTAEQNVQMALEVDSDSVLGPESKERARMALAEVGLDHRASHLPCELSGGQCQRVAVARALVHKPRLILADEPTASLDRESGERVAQLLREHATACNASIILVTHDPRITQLADRRIEMQDGCISSGCSV